MPKLGYLLPTRERTMEGRQETAPLLALAERAERLGFDSIWVGDSLLARPRHDPLTLLAAGAIVAFAALVAINSVGFLAKPVVEAATGVSRWCLVTAIAALGMKTSFKDLLTVGWRPVGLMLAETLWIALLVLASVEWLL